MNALYKASVSRDIDLRIVYILEAHANDEWPVGSQLFDYPQATTMELRAKAAYDFVTQFSILAPVVLDTIDNAFETEYAPWPFRFYVVDKGIIKIKPTPIDGTYNLCELWDLIDNYPIVVT